MEQRMEQPQAPVNGKSTRPVYVIRHGESRYNVAVRRLSLLGVIGERDHGLSDAGRAQCSQLMAALESGVAARDADALAIASGPRLASPLRRALQTAILALPGDARVTAIADGREPAALPILSRDSEGHMAAELGGALLREGCDPATLDLSELEPGQWWTVGEPHEAVAGRLERLLLRLHACDAPPVFVGHSVMIRELFRLFGEPESELARRRIENCAVVRMDLQVIDDKPRIVDGHLLFGSQVKK